MRDQATEIHAFTRGLEFPVLVYVSNERCRSMVSYLEHNFTEYSYTTEELCLWCIAHQMEYRIFVTDRELRRPMRKQRYERLLRQIAESG